MSDSVAEFIVAKSDQLNADDLVGGPITVRISRVEVTGGEQPVTVHLSDGWRPWKPCKTTMRVLALCWGTSTAPWVGRTVRLFRDPAVKWAGVTVGGIRVSGLSHIERAQVATLATSKGKKSEHRIDVLHSGGQTVTPARDRAREAHESDITATPVRVEAADVLRETVDAIAAWLREHRVTEADLRAYIEDTQGTMPPPVAKWSLPTARHTLAKLRNGWGARLAAGLRDQTPDPMASDPGAGPDGLDEGPFDQSDGE